MTALPVFDTTDTLTADEARVLTDRIATAIDGVWQLIALAYTSRAWDALGYASWDDYTTREFGSARLRLPREDRQEVVASLRDSGLSVRAISSATGASVGTIHSDLSGVQNRTPDEEPTEPAKVVGIDGKTYAPDKPKVVKVTDTTKTESFVDTDTGEIVDQPAVSTKTTHTATPVGPTLDEQLVEARASLALLIGTIRAEMPRPTAPNLRRLADAAHDLADLMDQS